jgi:hypothetical protein
MQLLFEKQLKDRIDELTQQFDVVLKMKIWNDWHHRCKKEINNINKN